MKKEFLTSHHPKDTAGKQQTEMSGLSVKEAYSLSSQLLPERQASN